MRLASPHFDRACLISGDGLRAIDAGQPAEGVMVADVDCCTGNCNQGRRCPARAHTLRSRSPRRRSRWGRVLRDLLRFLMSPRAW